MVSNETDRIIWTVGHSTRTADEFLEILTSFQIGLLTDVRRYPGSRKYPHFNASALQTWLPENGIQYVHQESLGGRRTPAADSTNTIWRNKSFRGYADYIETEEFAVAMEQICEMALVDRTVFMCSEAVWWRCHRALISDYLKERGWLVMHIMKEGLAAEHPFTSAYLAKHTHSP